MKINNDTTQKIVPVNPYKSTDESKQQEEETKKVTKVDTESKVKSSDPKIGQNIDISV